MRDKVLRWTADEYKKHDHDLGWYAGLFLFGAVLIAWGLYTNNIIATILFVLIVFILYALSHRHPDKVTIIISDKGVNLNNILYPYNSIKHFWIMHHHDSGPQLNFEMNALFNRHLTIELEEQDPQEVRAYLKEHIEEIEDYEENFIDFLIRRLRL